MITEISLPSDFSEARKSELIGYLCDKYKEATDARSSQVDSDYQRWINNYEAVPKQQRRNFPFTNASNLVIPLGQIHCDILEARILGFIYAVHPFYSVKSWPPTGKYQWSSALSQWLDFKMNYVWMWAPQIRSILGRSLRGGTCTTKLTLATKSYIQVTPGEGSAKLQEQEISRDCMYLDPIPFEDFAPYPFRANTLRDVQIKFQTLRLTKEEVERRKVRGIWDAIASEKLLTGYSETSEKTQTQQQTEQSAGVEPKKAQVPFVAVEAHLDYDLGGGKLHQLVITFDPKSKLLLKGIFNTIPRGLDNFIDFRLFPRDDCYFGYSLMQRLEMFQEEVSSIHNDRRNSNIVSSIPGFKKKRYADTPSPSSEWYVGKVWELENMDDLELLQFNKNYSDLISEENQSMQLAERISGISPHMQGFGAGVMQGKRGIYNASGTLALMQEGNRRVDIYLKDLRTGFSQVGKLTYLLLRENGINPSETNGYPDLQQALAQAEKVSDENMFFELAASTASTNREADRTAYLMMSQLLERYYSSIIAAATQVVQLQAMKAPPALIQLFLAILGGAHDVANHLLDAFDYQDKSKALPDARQLLLAGLAGGQNAGSQPNAEGNPGPAIGMAGPDLEGLSQMLASVAAGGGSSPSGPETERGPITQ
jgi:hypothetical protein